ncbi:T9SS type B sorting domain-containing protein [Flavobacterium luteum]|uniref:T9SS type B sorting domain-containing protein n=1 Tax=Flavobacterium luteum TaxID=2026654 RepID=A0A7J5AJX5_9FLAO|nr:T9SS type B sorting domain-containing protein [Flavobacterium luteum]KAB1157911.1 T9SS type B sorting domain-containing protein [Flavobacterium luteum]
MLLTIFQIIQATKNKCFALVFLSFLVSTNSLSQNLLTTNNNNPGFEGTGGFQANGYTNISPGTSGTSAPSNYAITGDSGPMNLASFKSVTPHSGTRMMVVDANNQIFWQGNPNIRLEGGVTYTFSYWVVNVNINGTSNPAFPNPVINFVAVDQCGCTVVLKSGSPTVNNGSWQQVVYEFTPSGTGAKWVRFELSTPGATPNGNDFAIDDISLFAPPAPLSISNSLTNPSCPGLSDGVIVAYPNGGVAPFSYTLSGAATATNTTGVFQGLSAGVYTVSVTDSNSPATTRTTPNITVSNPLDITLTSSPTGCILSGTPITLTAANGGASYSWSASTGVVISDTDAIANVSPLVTTTYTVSSTTVSPTTSANLIGNPGFENGTSGFFSDYGYSLSNTSGTQFAYGIVTNPNSWFIGFVSTSDHTTANGTGKMLVADGATVANSVIWSQIIPVETSKTYNFSFWAQNLVASSPAIFQVTINGTPITILPVSATNGASAGWTEIKGTWNSLAATIATIKIIDTNIASGGNDFALDDISFSTTTSKSCNLSTDLTVNIGGSSPITNFSYATPFCKDSTNPSPTGVTGFITGGTYTDDNATGLLSINASTGVINLSASTSGTYTIRYSVAANPGICQSAGSSTTIITINNTPTISGTLNVCKGLTRTLSGSGTPNAINPWVSATPAVATISNLGVVTGVSAGTSVITYKDNNGCTTTTSVTVNDLPTISGTLSVCSGSNTTLIGSGTSDASAPWTSASTSVATVNSSGVVSGVLAGTSLITYKNSNGCLVTETFTVNTTPILTLTCGTTTGSSVAFNWNSIADATSYSYSYSINSGAPITGVLLSSATTLTVNGLTPGQNVSVILTPIGSVCAKQATSNCVSSNCPTPIVDVISDFPSCANDIVSIPAFTSATSGITFNWTNTNASIGIAASGTGATIPPFNVINTTNTLQTATISVTANDGTCTGPAMTFDLDVFPLPTVIISAVKSSVCSGSATIINFNGTPNATVTYTVNSGVNQFLVLDASGNASLPTGNLTSNTLYSLISVLNPITNCSQTQSGTATVTINVLPTVTISGTTAVCSGTGTPISFIGTPNATVTYTIGSGANQTILLDAFGLATLHSGNLTSNTIYNLVSVVDTNLCSQTQIGDATISIDTLPIASISGSTSICTGTGASILFSGTPNTIVTYTINSGTNQTIILDGFGNASLPTGNLTANAVYSLVSVQDLSTTCFQTQSGNATVKIISLPTATILGTKSICSGTSTSIQFNGTPNATVTYTINSGINQTVNLDAIGNATITTGNLIATADYSLVSAEDSSKTCSQPQSGTASVNINPLPTATISGSTTICSGTGTSIQFNGTPDATVTYIVNSGSNQSIVLDASGQATLPTGNLISNTIYILVSVSDSITSCSQLQSETASVTINALPIVTISGTTAICSGASATITFTGTPNATVTYTVDSVNNLTIDLDPAGEATLATGNLSANTTYSLIDILDSTTTCSQLQSGTATVSINDAPDVVPTTINQPICSGQSSGVLLTSTTAGTIFNWTVIESGVAGATSGIGNNISQVLTTTSPINVGTADFTVTPTANGCSGLPIVVTVSVSPTPTAVATPDKDVICSGAATAIALSSGNSQTTFNWNVIQNNVIGATNDSGNLITQVLQTAINNFGEAVYAITPSLNGCNGLTILVPITVNPVPDVSTNVFNNPICSGNATNIDLTSNVAGTTFTWSVVQTNVKGAISSSGNTIAQIIKTTGNSLGVAEFTITPQINSCIGNPIIVPIQVNPSPEEFGPSSTTICSGKSPKISLIPIIVGTSFNWTHLSDNVSGATDGNGDKIDQVLLAENNPGKVLYTVTPSLGGCIGNSFINTVNVNPAPIVNLENGVLCLEANGDLKKSLILNTNLNDALYDFEWYFNTISTPISGAIESLFEAKELGDYFVNVRDTSTGCTAKSNTAMVTEVNPTNSFDVIVSDAFTENTSITVTGQNVITTYLYQIDNGALQSSNVFSGIGAGTYTIRVTDSDGCTDYSKGVQVIDYPKYFTPNGDGFNDTWNIKGLSNQSNATLFIYDRYGKLLKQISPKGQGWDGTFNGVQLPATDYWFTVDYLEPNNDINKLFKAHFSLKR